jgi:hypothetical protein
MTKFATIFRFYCHTYLSHFPRKQRLFFVELFLSLYPCTRYSWKQRRHKASMCHHPKDRFTLKIVAIAMKHRRNRDKKACQSKKLTNNLRHRCHTYDEKAWKVATKNRGNSDETSWQSKNSPTSYDADAIRATKKRGKVRRKIVAIATKNLGRVKTHQWLATNLRRYCHAFCRFKKKIEYSLIIYTRGMNLCIYEPVHGGMWYQEIKYIKARFCACELIALIFPGSLHMKAPRLDCSSVHPGSCHQIQRFPKLQPLCLKGTCICT